MHLKTLSLKNYRNFKGQKINFNPEFNFFIGKNAQGKTNLIEAIYYLAELKSFRTTNRQELLLRGERFSQIYAEFEKEDLSWTIDVTLTHDERKVLLNQKKPKTRQEYYGLIPLVLFEPRSIYLFRETPSKRRKYLNRALYIQDVNVLSVFRDYDRVISQKNKLLKEGAGVDLIDVWNDRLAVLAAEIICRRLGWLQEARSFLSEEYKQISNSCDEVSLNYHCSLNDFDTTQASVTAADVTTHLKYLLKERQGEERGRRESLIGPHRDDFSICIGDRHLGNMGSQGENRSAVIALKLTQLKMYDAKYNKTPLFLLDDVASELDEERCQYLFSYLRTEKTQVFLSTTDSTTYANDFSGHASSYVVKEGAVVT